MKEGFSCFISYKQVKMATILNELAFNFAALKKDGAFGYYQLINGNYSPCRFPTKSNIFEEKEIFIKHYSKIITDEGEIEILQYYEIGVLHFRDNYGGSKFYRQRAEKVYLFPDGVKTHPESSQNIPCNFGNIKEKIRCDPFPHTQPSLLAGPHRTPSMPSYVHRAVPSCPSIVPHEENLPSHVIVILKETAIKSGDTCPISFEPITMGNSIVTSCGHIFTKDAFKTWGRSTCPTCRKKCVAC